MKNISKIVFVTLVFIGQGAISLEANTFSVIGTAGSLAIRPVIASYGLVTQLWQWAWGVKQITQSIWTAPRIIGAISTVLGSASSLYALRQKFNQKKAPQQLNKIEDMHVADTRVEDTPVENTHNENLQVEDKKMLLPKNVFLESAKTNTPNVVVQKTESTKSETPKKPFGRKTHTKNPQIQAQAPQITGSVINGMEKFFKPTTPITPTKLVVQKPSVIQIPRVFPVSPEIINLGAYSRYNQEKNTGNQKTLTQNPQHRIKIQQASLSTDKTSTDKTVITQVPVEQKNLEAPKTPIKATVEDTGFFGSIGKGLDKVLNVAQDVLKNMNQEAPVNGTSYLPDSPDFMMENNNANIVETETKGSREPLVQNPRQTSEELRNMGLNGMENF